jgi:hypothetical protein
MYLISISRHSWRDFFMNAIFPILIVIDGAWHPFSAFVLAHHPAPIAIGKNIQMIYRPLHIFCIRESHGDGYI